MPWEVLAHGYGLAEAPTIDRDGTLLFSDVLGGGVYRWDATGNVATTVPKRRGVGGIAVHADGGFVCSGRDLLHVRDGERITHGAARRRGRGMERPVHRRSRQRVRGRAAVRGVRPGGGGGAG